MRQAAVAVALSLLSVSCGNWSSPRGPVFVLKPILATPTNRLPDHDAVKHDADVIAKRFALLGYRRLRALPAEDGMSIQFPRSVDDGLVSDVVGRRGALAFCLVQEERVTYDALKTMDEKVKAGPGADTGPSAVGEAEEGTLLSHVRTIGGDFGVDDQEYPQVKQLLERVQPYWPEGYEFLFGPSEAVEGSAVRRLYMLKAEPEMYGPVIEDAQPAPYEGSDASLANTWIVSFKLGRKDAAVFAQVTSRSIGRRIAIVLDSVVQSAPVVQTRIPEGNGMITTNNANEEEARHLSVLLRTGMLGLRWRVETKR